jgi:RimJ/RimL family protein N-acetyltransferase
MTIATRLGDADDTARGAAYRVRVAGHLDDHWSDRLGGGDLVRNPDRTTTLTVDVVDQARLHGVLTGIRDLGVTLLSVDRAEDPALGRSETTPPAGIERPLHTDRLTLRRATVDDAGATWSYRRLDVVNEWLSGATADAEDYRTLFVEPARLSATVIVELGHQPGRRIIGDVMLRREDAWAQTEVSTQATGAQAELGWVLDPAHRGAGYATEAVRELLRDCFEDLGVHRVVASCVVDDDGSWRLMERLGMRRELHAAQHALHRSGRWLDTVGYALLADEWGGWAS